MSRTFVTIFPICENVHLTKDLGQIPYFLHRTFSYNARIVSYKNSQQYSNLDGEVKGLKMEFIPNRGRVSFLERSVLSYIYKNAKSIDVLNLYIFSKFTFVYGILYKKLNPNGFLFLKLDGYNETFAEQAEVRHSVHSMKNRFLKSLEKKFLKQVDLITIENSEGEGLVKRKFPQVAHKVSYLPVGVNDVYLREAFPRRKLYHEKENIILTVGRVGEEIKNHDMMLRALARLDLKDWKLVFVGPVNPSFEQKYKAWIREYPHLESRILFTGEICDRKTLYAWYDRSKIFCMTSLKESFCHSIGEALYFGNYIIGTEGIVSMPDITNRGKYGTTLKTNDDAALAEALQNRIDNESSLAELCPEIMHYSDNQFTWSGIIGRIHERIERRPTV